MEGSNWKLEEDLKTIIVTFPTNPIVRLRFDAVGVDELIKKLGEVRSAMKPEISPDYSISKKVDAVPNPRYFIDTELLQGNCLLHLRDPRYGWLNYMLPRVEAANLGRHLKAQAESPSPGPLQGKPN